MTDFQTQQKYDIVIIGGGLVGSSLALGLHQTPYRVAVIEARAWSENEQISATFDDRVIALSYSSHQIFKNLGVWDVLQDYVTPMHKIHVSEQGKFGSAWLERELLNTEALGYVIRAKPLGLTLQTRVAEQARHTENLNIFAETTVESLHFSETKQLTTLTINHAGQMQQLSTQLLVIAEGSQGKLTELLGGKKQQHDYQQTAIIANLVLSQSHQNVAFERFTQNGAMALLPLDQQQATLIWSVPNEEVNFLRECDDGLFLQYAQRAFGWRIGRFTQIGTRAYFPLYSEILTEFSPNAVVVIGNAAHTLHPVAGQGFNLGLRDVATLVEAIDLHGLTQAIPHYKEWQQQDQQRVALLTDGLIQLFNSSFAPVKFVRSKGLMLLESIPFLKRWFVRQMTGLKGHPTKLMRF